MTDREACIVLNMLNGVGHARFQALVSYFESPAAVLERNVDELKQVKGIGSELAAKIANWRQETNLEEELNLVERGGAKIITLLEPEYPSLLKDIYDPPICLYVRGKLPDFNVNSLAVVGSRRITIYGRKMTRYLTESAVYAGWKIISGLAYGVDAVAHQTAVELRGITVAVLGGGLARIHPQDHIPLARDIVEQGGALISEFPMKFPVSRQSFPRRNRIVSGLSRAVLIVEAGIDSGAMITANSAIEQGRSVFAVPGAADNPQARGCHKLIKEGARLTESFEDILEEFDFLPGFSGMHEPENNYPDVGEVAEEPVETCPQPVSADTNESAIISLLTGKQKTFDALAQESGIAAGTLLALLMKMEIKKTIVQHPGKIFSLR